MSLFLLIAYIIVFIVQLIFFVKAIRKKTKKFWIGLFLIEIIPILIAIGLMLYYESLPGYGFMPGLSYLGEILSSFGAVVLYAVMFVSSAIICIVNGERKKKLTPFFAVAGFLFFVIGICFFGCEFISNFEKTKSVATFVGYEELRTGSEAEQWPVLEFYVGQEKYQSRWPELKSASVGDEIEIYYYPVGDSYECTLYVADYRMIYITAFVLGILFFVARWKIWKKLNQGGDK